MTYWCLNDESVSEMTLMEAFISFSDANDADELALSGGVGELKIIARII